MKRSEEILGLSVISIEDGKEVGRVSDLIINSREGQVDYLVVDNGLRYLGIRILPFNAIEGIGEYAVTIQSSSSVTDLSEEPGITSLLEMNVRVRDTKVLTKKGRLVGTVSEFIVDEDYEGKITACEVTPANTSENKGLVPADQIITFGKEVLVINEGIQLVSDDIFLGSPAPELVVVDTGDTEETVETEKESGSVSGQKPEVSEPQEQSEAAKLFEERQRQYMLGRKVSKRIETESGEVIAEEGDVVTEELMDKAKAAGKFAELSMNTKA